ncbi:MAG: M20/M25/M40 family metallo-hydrolase [Candidatus Njordarchaeales archaeon]
MSDEITLFEEFVSPLIKLNTVAVNKEECEMAANYVWELFIKNNFDSEVIITEEGNPVVIAKIDGKTDKYLLFYDHYDVQPAEPIDEWNTPPFELTAKDGKYVARGIADNKGDLVSRIIAVRSYIEENGELPIGIKFVVEGEEEQGSMHLKDALMQKRDFFKDVIGVIWEFGHYTKDEKINLILGLKGLLYMILKKKVIDHDAHSSLAVVLPSAVWEMIAFLHNMKEKGLRELPEFNFGIIDARKVIEEIEKANYTVYWDSKTLKEEYGITKFVNNMSDEDAKIAYYQNPTFNIDGIVAGYTGPGAKTVLPKEIEVKIDFRLVPYQNPEAIAEAFIKVAKDAGVEAEIHSYTKPVFTEFDHPFTQKVANAIKNLGEKFYISPWSPASGPMDLFVYDLDLPTIAGIGISYWGSRAHSPNENVRIKDVIRTIKIIKGIIKSFEE